MVEGLRLYTLWDEIKTRAGGLGNIASAWPLVGGETWPVGQREKRSRESEDQQSPLSKWLIIRR